MADSTLDPYKIAALIIGAGIMFAAGYGTGVRHANSDWVAALRTMTRPEGDVRRGAFLSCTPDQECIPPPDCILVMGPMIWCAKGAPDGR